MVALKHHDELSIDAISELLAITPTAVRQHLGPLVAEGLVTFRESGSGPGRRKRLYRLTRAGEALFPSAAGELAPLILAELREVAPERVTALFRRLHESVAQKLRDSLPLHAAADVPAVVRSFDERGFMPAACGARAEAACVCLHHCPLRAFAEVAPEVCDAEQAMIGRLFPEATVTRTRHRLAGDRTCAYVIAPRTD